LFIREVLYQMESAIYGYYYVKTDCIKSTWDTKEIEAFLLNDDRFVSKGNGSFDHNNTFLSLQLMLVKDYNSWSSNDYNSSKTNYIDIVTHKEVNLIMTQFL